MAKVLITNDRLVHMACTATLDESSSSDESSDSDVTSNDDTSNDEEESESLNGITALSESQYSLLEHDDSVEFIVREDLDEDVVGPDDMEDHLQEDLGEEEDEVGQGENVLGEHDSVHDPTIEVEALVRRPRRYRFRRRRLLEVLDENETYESEFKEVFRMSWITFREVILSTFISYVHY